MWEVKSFQGGGGSLQPLEPAASDPTLHPNQHYPVHPPAQPLNPNASPTFTELVQLHCVVHSPRHDFAVVAEGQDGDTKQVGPVLRLEGNGDTGGVGVGP
jgi:hypothetical protein